MEAWKNPAYPRSLGQALGDFCGALAAFLELHVVNTTVARGVAPAVVPRDDVDPEEIALRSARVAKASGQAAPVVSLTGIAMSVQGAGTTLIRSRTGRRSPGRNRYLKPPTSSAYAITQRVAWRV